MTNSKEKTAKRKQMRKLLIILSPLIMFTILTTVAFMVVVGIAMFVTNGDIGTEARGLAVFVWIWLNFIIVPASFFDTSLARGIMADILDLMRIDE